MIIENLKINGQIVDKDIEDFTAPTEPYPYWVFYTTEGKIYATGNVAFLVKRGEK
jgi:hypothetical protein